MSSTLSENKRKRGVRVRVDDGNASYSAILAAAADCTDVHLAKKSRAEPGTDCKLDVDRTTLVNSCVSCMRKVRVAAKTPFIIQHAGDLACLAAGFDRSGIDTSLGVFSNSVWVDIQFHSDLLKNLEFVQAFQRLGGLQFDNRNRERAVWDHACKNNTLAVLMWIFATYPGLCNNYRLTSAARIVYTRGFRPMFKWIVQQFMVLGFTDPPYIFSYVLEAGDLAMFKWMVVELKLSSGDALDLTSRESLGNANVAARIGLCKWLESCGADRSKVREMIVSKSCKDYAHIFDFAYEKSFSHIVEIRMFLIACSGDDTKLAARLHSKFTFSPDDLQKAFQTAVRIGSLDMIKWLATCSPITRKFIVHHWDTFCDACYRPPVAQWMVARFAITTADLRAQDCFVLRSATVSGNLDALKWLMGPDFELTAKDLTDSGATNPLDEYIDNADEYARYTEVVDWIKLHHQ